MGKIVIHTWGQSKMTERQKTYLRQLTARAGETFRAGLTKGEAAEEIERLMSKLGIQKKGKTRRDPEVSSRRRIKGDTPKVLIGISKLDADLFLEKTRFNSWDGLLDWVVSALKSHECFSICDDPDELIRKMQFIIQEYEARTQKAVLPRMLRLWGELPANVKPSFRSNVRKVFAEPRDFIKDKKRFTQVGENFLKLCEV